MHCFEQSSPGASRGLQGIQAEEGCREFWCESFQVYLCASSIIAKSSAMDPQTHPDAG